MSCLFPISGRETEPRSLPAHTVSLCYLFQIAWCPCPASDVTGFGRGETQPLNLPELQFPRLNTPRQYYPPRF